MLRPSRRGANARPGTSERNHEKAVIAVMNRPLGVTLAEVVESDGQAEAHRAGPRQYSG
jgi:hypothetical protein